MAGKRFPGEAETILKKADRQYDAFRRSTPDIGGKKTLCSGGGEWSFRKHPSFRQAEILSFRSCSSWKRFSILPGLMQPLNRLGKQSPPGRSAARPLIGFGSLA